MKIIFLINSPYPRYAGGIENWLYNVSQRLSNDHEIIILSHNNNDYPILYSDISEKIKIYKYKTLQSFVYIKEIIRGYLKLIDLFIGSYSMGRKLIKLLPKNEEYIIIALDSLFCVKAALLSKKKIHPQKIISSVRGPHAEILGRKYKLFSNWLLRYEKSMLSNVDQIWANGYDTIDLLKQKGHKSLLIKNGVDFKTLNNIRINDIDFINLIKHSISIVNVGSLLPIKGIYELIDAVSMIIKERNTAIQLVFIGKGNPESFVRYAKKRGILKNTHFIGHKSNPITYVKECTLTTCLSGGSGMSMVAIESMLSHIPIIAWNTPVYQQFNRTTKTMILVEEKNVYELSKAIIDIIDNPSKHNKMIKNAELEAHNYDWEIVCNQLIKYLNNDI